jgi:hypothetical protein
MMITSTIQIIHLKTNHKNKMNIHTLLTDDELRLPVARRASEELPDKDVLHALGIPLDDLDEARLVACVLSRFLGRGHADSRSHLRAMMAALSVCCSIDIVYEGEIEPGPHPELARLTWPSASSVFRRLGITAETLDAYWISARNRASDACFPIEWLLGFFPPALWAAVAALIGWGPETTRIRLEEAAIAMGRMGTKKETRRRPKGSPLAYGTIDAWITELVGLVDGIVALRTQVKARGTAHLPVERLEPWVIAPQRPNLRQLGVKPSGQDNGGPPLADVQRRLKELAREYEERSTYHRLRKLILLALLALLGPRATALRMADVSDFVPDVPGPDGVRHDVLELRPGKTWARGDVHRLPLPPEIAGWLRAWITLTGREIGEQNTPLFPHKKPKRGMRLRHLSEVGFYLAIAGRPREPGVSGSHALIHVILSRSRHSELPTEQARYNLSEHLARLALDVKRRSASIRRPRPNR